MATIIDTPEGISRYQALCVKQGLRAVQIGMRLNTAYTPKRLMAMVEKITGKKHKARDYEGALASLQEWLDRT